VQRLGPYQLEAELGRGGMGVVYRALDPRLGRRVAIKTITDPGPEARARFEVEAQAGGRLSHRNLVGVHDLGYAGGFLYLVSEFVAGESLDHVLKRQGKLDPDRAAGLIERLAGGLAYAHAAGVLHRDIKPANVLIDESGEPRLTDFGVARIGSGANTHTGELLGTVDYMSPEQASGEWDRIDARADVYSLGATLYELLTGRPPFREETLVATLTKLMTKPLVPPGQLVELPPGLGAIVERSLAKEPAQRYASAEAFAGALAAWREERAQAPERAQQSRFAWGSLALAVLVLSVALVLGWAGLRSYDPPARPSQTRATPDQKALEAERLLARGDLLWRSPPPAALRPLDALEAYSQAATYEPAAYAGLAEILGAGHGSPDERRAALELLETAEAPEALAALASLARAKGDLARLAELAQRLWAKGDPRGHVWRGQLLAKRKELAAAEAAYREVVRDPRGQVAMGAFLVAQGRFAEGRALLAAASAAEHPEAWIEEGECFRRGQGVTADPARAAELFRRAAEAESREAMYRLGLLQSDQRGVDRDWQAEAARRGHLEAARELAFRLMREGQMEEAFAWMERASLWGNHFATAQRGRWLREGEGVPRDFPAALEVWRWGAAQGSYPCLTELGPALMASGKVDEGRQALADLVAAKDPGALTLVGESCLKQVPRDPARGLALLEEAAGQDFGRAVLLLAKHYRELGQAKQELRYAEQAARLNLPGASARAAALRQQLGRE
jgi:TPR repeat protein